MIDLDKLSFRGLRAALETLGASAPDRLERESLARLVISATPEHYTELAPGPSRGFEAISVNVPLTVAQLSYVKLQNRVGFYLNRVTNRSAVPIAIGTSPPALLAAQSTASGTVTRQFQAIATTSMFFETGTTLTALAFGFNLVAGEVYQPNMPLWIPAGLVVQIHAGTLATVMDALVVISEPIP